MTNPNQPANEEIQPPVPTASALHQTKQRETAETPELQATVELPTNTMAGRYVGLGALQRKSLGVEVGDTVELRDNQGISLGHFTVGSGRKELIANRTAISCSVQEIVDGRKVVTVRKVTENTPLQKLQIEREVEGDEKHAGRLQKITERDIHKETTPDAYLVLPTAAATCCPQSPSRATLRMITIANVKIGSKTYKMGIVPSGTTFGFTSKAAEILGIPTTATSIHFGVSEDTITIDKVE